MNNPGELTTDAWELSTVQDMHDLGLLQNVGLFTRMPACWLRFDGTRRMTDVRNDEPVGLVFLENWHMGTCDDPWARSDPRFERRLPLDAIICKRLVIEAGRAIDAAMDAVERLSGQ